MKGNTLNRWRCWHHWIRRCSIAHPYAAGLIGLLILSIGGFVLAGNQYYAERIFPGVHVYGVPVGGLTVEAASDDLRAAFPDPADLPLTLRDGERTWKRTWADVGLRFDAAATARLAYRVGREGSPDRRWTARWRSLRDGWPLVPAFQLPNPAEATEALSALAPDVAIPPVNATLLIRAAGDGAGDSVIPVPAQAGLALDVQATVDALPHTLGRGPDGIVMDLLTRIVEPAVTDSAAAQAHVERLLSGPFTLVADDPLTGAYTTWSVEPETLARWLIVQPIEAPDEAWLAVTIRKDIAQQDLEALEGAISDGVVLDAAGSIAAVQAAVEAGAQQVQVAVTHLPHIYVVQPGDTLVSIAHAHGFPVWRLQQVNAELDAERLRPTQQILIPSIDVLFPLPLVEGRRIVVNISEQRLQAYEGDNLVYDFIASTGVASSPTIAGAFQVLSKQEEAYASSWDLWMPHFMGIYRTAPDFTNGIHALPTLSNGVRLWEGVLGRPVSYGCIVLGLEEAAALYRWTELGTLVRIQE